MESTGNFGGKRALKPEKFEKRGSTPFLFFLETSTFELLPRFDVWVPPPPRSWNGSAKKGRGGEAHQQSQSLLPLAPCPYDRVTTTSVIIPLSDQDDFVSGPSTIPAPKTLLDLPNEILFKVFEHLSRGEIINCKYTCWRLYLFGEDHLKRLPRPRVRVDLGPMVRSVRPFSCNKEMNTFRESHYCWQNSVEQIRNKERRISSVCVNWTGRYNSPGARAGLIRRLYSMEPVVSDFILINWKQKKMQKYPQKWQKSPDFGVFQLERFYCAPWWITGSYMKKYSTLF